ncbi:hypothetical protein [Subtercola endophyticus]|uniref:hypothetical protein n=1 Tax=Subtercola endophyticus TaxID=2895559 RepID=UPI001E2D46C5|nr:hypothetical protein [Subtercola endophyticus]UFS57679.1 hypothetical protein LQ955_11515 [Subtercola endophyticus]
MTLSGGAVLPQHDENTSGITSTSGEAGSVSRRSVMKAAAWSAPVVALAVGAPAASASTSTVTILFVASELKLHHSTTLSVLVGIHNTGTTDVSDAAQIVLSGIPDDQVDFAYDTSQTHYVPASDDTETTATDVQNEDFTLAAHQEGDSTYTLVSTRNIAVAAGTTVYIFFTLTWPADNPHPEFFVIAGSFSFGHGNDAHGSSDTVQIDYTEG